MAVLIGINNPRGINVKRRNLAILVVFVAIAGLAYFGSPYWVTNNLKSAVVAGDADKMETLIDFPMVRDGLKSEMSAALLSKFQNDPQMKNNPFAGLGMMMLPSIVDKAVDAYITPEGLRRIIKDGRPQAEGNTDAGGAQGQPNVDYTSEYVSKDRFRVHLRIRSTGELGPALLFERRGFIAWKLAKIELPDNWLNKP